MRAKHFETVSQELHHKFHHIFHHRFHHRFHHNFIIARAEFFVSNWDSGRNVISYQECGRVEGVFLEWFQVLPR